MDLKNKEVISIKDGCKIGCVNDVEIEMNCAKIIAIVIYGRLKCFGLLGREDDIVIKWDCIKVIGDDTILVSCNPMHHYKRKFNFINNFCKIFK